MHSFHFRPSPTIPQKMCRGARAKLCQVPCYSYLKEEQSATIPQKMCQGGREQSSDMSDTCAKLLPCQFLFKGGGVCSVEITSPPSWDAGFSTGAGENVRSTGLSGGGVELRGVPQSVPTRLFTVADSELGEIKIRPEKFSSVLYIIFSGGSLQASQGMHGAATLPKLIVAHG